MTTLKLTVAEIRLLDIRRAVTSLIPPTSSPGGQHMPPNSPRWNANSSPNLARSSG